FLPFFYSIFFNGREGRAPGQHSSPPQNLPLPGSLPSGVRKLRAALRFTSLAPGFDSAQPALQAAHACSLSDKSSSLQKKYELIFESIHIEISEPPVILTV